jgi:uncharacterized membrane protein YfcA
LILAGLAFAGLESLHHMNALKILLNCIINAVTIIVFVLAPWISPSPDRIHWPLALGMGVAAIVGGFVGMQIARKMKPDRLRVLILCVGVILTAVYFYKKYFAK